MEKKETKLSVVIIGLLVVCLAVMICLSVIIRLKQSGNSSATEAASKEIVLQTSDSPAEEEEDEQFVIIDAEKTIGDFVATVPQIDGDSDKINKINALILDKIESKFLELDEERKIDYLTYNIQLLNSEILSILFESSDYAPSAPYPADRAFTLNVALREGKELDTGNLLADKEALCEYIKSGKAEKDFVEGEKGNGKGKSYLFDKSYVKRQTISDISNELENEAQFYFTPGKVGIVYFTIHAVGDYFLLEIGNGDFFEEKITEMCMPPAEENDTIHEEYIRYLREREEEEEYGYRCKYTFYDIDRNGIDELIYEDSYLGTTICSYKDGDLVGLNYNKYGGDDFKIYPDEGVVFWSSEHMDNYYDTYFEIAGTEIETVASKYWIIKHVDDDTEVIDKCDYKVRGEKVKKSRYKEFTDSLNEENAVTNKQLEWNKLQKDTNESSGESDSKGLKGRERIFWDYEPTR